ncbi:MAG: hypothetical protein P9M15_00025 [Candidatus Electryoneaceae bacterium]|nr:hypothetical protein [Candidatus Electryoneaceae bacterium]
MSTKELQGQLVDILKRWQKVEDASVASTGNVIDKTDNPIIRLVMELIQRDSQFHYRVQDFMIDILEGKTVTLTPDELVDIWDGVEKHIEIEKNTIELAKEALELLKGRKMVIHEYLLNYLMIDEEKHNAILDSLATIKKGMYPYG